MPNDRYTATEAKNNFPLVSNHLLFCMKVIYPKKNPKHFKSEWDLAFHAGQQQVIQFLQEKHNEQLIKLGKEYIP